MHLLTFVEDVNHGCTDALNDAVDNLLHKLFVSDAHRWVDKLACEAAIAQAFSLPNLFLTPVTE